MRRFLMIFLMMASVASSYAQQWSEKDLEGLEVYKIRSESQFYKNIAAKLGDILIAYRYGGLTFKNAVGDYINVYDYAYFVAEKDGKLTFLGKMEKTRIVDAFGKVLYDASTEDPRLFPNVVGVSSSITRTLTQPTLVALGKERSGATFYYETELVMPIEFDLERKTITRAKITY